MARAAVQAVTAAQAALAYRVHRAVQVTVRVAAVAAQVQATVRAAAAAAQVQATAPVVAAAAPVVAGVAAHADDDTRYTI